MELLLGAALLQVSLGTLTLGDFVGKALVVYCPSRPAPSLSIAYLERVSDAPMTSVTLVTAVLEGELGLHGEALTGLTRQSYDLKRVL